VIAEIQAGGCVAISVEADLSDPQTPASLFDTAEERLGAVDILISNATGWVQDTFAPGERDRFGRTLAPVDAHTWR
jgi:3-oxoacyl-[acyl-carrier protein] reductase